MKTVDTKVESKGAETKSPSPIEQYLDEQMKKNPQGGEIELDTIEKATNSSRGDVVSSLRKFRKAGTQYIVGRKGYPSRFVWGEKVNTQSPKTPRRVAPQKTTNGGELQLKLSINNQEVLVPLNIKTELVAA